MAKNTSYDEDGLTHNGTKSTETGLFTRCVPSPLKHSALYRWWLRFTRVLQFLSATISLGIFSSRVYKVYRLVNSIKAERGLNNASGAVEGILAAAVLYTLLATLMMCLLRGGGPTWLRWLFVILDLLFLGAFIAVSVLTRPNGGSAGPAHCYRDRNSAATAGTGQNVNTDDQSCNLPWGTFILAIISTILHFITASFNEVKDHHMKNKKRHAEEAMVEHDSSHGMQKGTGHGGNEAENGRPNGSGHIAPNGSGHGAQNGHHYLT